MKEYLSLVPGPTQVHPRVLASMSEQVMTHLNEEWKPYYLRVCDKMRKIFKTSGEVFLMASSGTGAMEAAVSSMIAPGEKILVLSNGLFGERIAMIARSYRLDVEVLSFPTDGPSVLTRFGHVWKREPMVLPRSAPSTARARTAFSTPSAMLPKSATHFPFL